MKVTCIDANGKPEGVKNSNWLKQNEEYTVVAHHNSAIDGDYYVLEEIQPDKPYSGYKASRFSVNSPTKKKEEKLETSY
jgi:hypothetical protein